MDLRINCSSFTIESGVKGLRLLDDQMYFKIFFITFLLYSNELKEKPYRVPRAEIKKLTLDIENRIFRLCRGVNASYHQKSHVLIMQLKDFRNQVWPYV